jgi:AcrR family transcriptional regulator
MCRADARRLQVLEAASTCFRRHGFHGTSMAELSKAAGMSVGHIYHYFENKEAIIAAIVESNIQRTKEIGRQIEADAAKRGGNRFAAMLDCIDRQCIDEVLDDPNTALMVEIVAEAARNEKIAEIVRTENEQRCSWSREMLLEAHRASGSEATAEIIDGQVVAIDALFDGLALQGLRRPDLDRDTLALATRAALKGILGA